MKYDIVKLMARRKIRWKKRWVSGDSGGRLTFRSKKAGRLSDYRIYGNTVGGESVGDLVESGEHAGEYEVSVTVSNGTDTLTTPIYLPEPIKMVGDEAEYIDYAEQKQYRVRKNLWSGIVEQGSVSTTGVYAYDIKRIRSKNVPIKPGAYTISCNLAIRCIYAYNNNEKVSCVVDNGGGRTFSNTFTVPSDANNVSISLRSFDASGAEIDVTTSDFEWGQIEKGSEVTTYEPYIEDTDLDVILPALPTLPGTNVLSVGTAVQPSRVEVKGRIKAVGQETEPEPETAEPEQEAAEAEQE